MAWSVSSLYFTILISISFTDRTRNTEICRDITYARDDKYITCVYSDNATGSDLCHNTSSALAHGGHVEWCVRNSNCFNHTTAGSTTLYEVSSTGVLHILSVNPTTLTSKVPNVNCTVFNSSGNICGTSERRLSVYTFDITTRPLIRNLNMDPYIADIGAAKNICLQGTFWGTNGMNRWIVDGKVVNATDISMLTNEANLDINRRGPALCTTCSCWKKYLSAVVLEKMQRDLEINGVASFIVAYYNDDSIVQSREARQCFGIPDAFLMVLMIRQVMGTPGEIMGNFTITSSQNLNTIKSFSISKRFLQIKSEVIFDHFSPNKITLSPRTKRLFICNASVAGDSNITLEWLDTNGLQALPSLSTVKEINISHSNITQSSAAALCQGVSGQFTIDLPSYLGPYLRLYPNGSFLLHLQTALLFCGTPSRSANFTCLPRNSAKSGVFLQVSVPSNVLSYIIIIVVVILLTTFCIIITAIWLCVMRYRRSIKEAPIPMSMLPSPPWSQGTNPTFAYYDDGVQDLEYSEHEFSREKLSFISILGEGQFGQVWKATAEGICPSNANRSIVAVKTLKPNARPSDNDDLHFELRIMCAMEPHPNIINFLGMCPETVSHSLLILMEYAMYGSLKDYLKKLSSGQLSPPQMHHLRQNLTEGDKPSALNHCVCSCHSQECSSNHETISLAREQHNGPHSLSPCLSLTEVSSLPDNYCDPVAMAHAARLLRLLDTNYCYHSNFSIDTSYDEGRGAHSGMDATPIPEMGGRKRSSSSIIGLMCAYHSSFKEYPSYYGYNWAPASHSMSGYYNSYYNHRDSARPVARASSKVDTPDSIAYSVCPRPSYVNIPEDDKEEDAVSTDYTCHCSDLPYYNNRGDPNHNVSCAYCSVQSKGGSVVDQNRKLSYFEVLDYASQIANGMEHLEKMKIVHRDLAARNVLIAEGFLLKIGDFGLTRELEQDKDYYRKLSMGKVPARWMAIESLEERKHTSKSDVWSYGVVLWEVLTYGKVPYGRAPVASSIDSLAAYISSGHRLPRPHSCSVEMYKLLKKCWDKDPTRRPSFSQLSDTFSTLLKKSPDHLNMSIEDTINHPHTNILEAQVFASVETPTLPTSRVHSLSPVDDTLPPPNFSTELSPSRTDDLITESTPLPLILSPITHSPLTTTTDINSRSIATPTSLLQSNNGGDLKESQSTNHSTKEKGTSITSDSLSSTPTTPISENSKLLSQTKALHKQRQSTSAHRVVWTKLRTLNSMETDV